MFSGFPEETIRFFLDIRFHNEVSFYKAHEDEYQTFVKKPFYSLIEELGETMLSISDDLEVRGKMPGAPSSRYALYEG